MNKPVTGLIGFIFGAIAGSIVAWKLLEEKYKKLAQEEIDSVKETFAKRKAAEAAKEKPSLAEYVAAAHGYSQEGEKKERGEDMKSADKADNIKKTNKRAERMDYSSYSNPSKEAQKSEVVTEDEDGPYVISPDEFGEKDDYETSSLTYYADGVLEDDFGNIVEDVEHTVGRDSLNHFGEYEDDSVFVRNDKHKCDYEILRDVNNYHESD